MLKRIGVAVAAIALLLPLQVSAQKGGRSSRPAQTIQGNREQLVTIQLQWSSPPEWLP